MYKYIRISLIITTFIAILTMSSFALQQMKDFSNTSDIEISIGNNDPVIPIRYTCYLKDMTYIAGINSLTLEVQDTKTGYVTQVSLYGVSPIPLSTIIDELKEFIHQFINEQVIVVSRIHRELMQFDQVAIKIKNNDNAMIDLTEWLLYRGFVILNSNTCKIPIVCENFNSVENYARQNKMGIWWKQ